MAPVDTSLVLLSSMLSSGPSCKVMLRAAPFPAVWTGLPAELEPIDLTAPAKRIIRVASLPAFIPIDPAVDIHPNGGIPG